MTSGREMASQIRVMLEGVWAQAEVVLAFLDEREMVRDGLDAVGTGVERDDLVGEAVGSGNVEGWLRVETISAALEVLRPCSLCMRRVRFRADRAQW